MISTARESFTIPPPTGGDAYAAAARRMGRLLVDPRIVDDVAPLFHRSPGRATAFTSARVRFWLARITEGMKPAVAHAFWCAALDPDCDHLVLDDTAMRVPSSSSFVDLGNRPLPLRLLRALVAAPRERLRLLHGQQTVAGSGSRQQESAGYAVFCAD